MTLAVNLANLANFVNSSGQLSAAAGLTNAVPIANGGTGATTAPQALTNLGAVGTSGAGATGTWGINISGNAATATSASVSTTQPPGTSNTTIATTEFVMTNGSGGGTKADGCIYLNNQTISANYVFPPNQNGMSAGPITIATGVTVTVQTGCRWTIV